MKPTESGSRLRCELDESGDPGPWNTQSPADVLCSFSFKIALPNVNLIAFGNTICYVSAPKVYAFDTGFLCYYRGWHELRRDDMGLLWEHYVMNEIFARFQQRGLCYWRDKSGHEVDFVLQVRGKPPVAIECKWSASDFDSRNLQILRRSYPEGENFVVASDIDRPFSRTYGQIRVRFVGLEGLLGALKGAHDFGVCGF